MRYFSYILVFFLSCFVSCNLTKNIPDNQYLLSKVNIKNDTYNATSDLESYIRQLPNGKVRLGLYNMANDTVGWRNKLLRKWGRPPVLYSAKDTKKSAQQLQQELVNEGYLSARVDTLLRIDGKKMEVTYDIHGGIPYRIREYEYQISDTTMRRIMDMAMKYYYVKPEIQKGDYFNTTLIEGEIDRVTTVMRNTGYADFSSEYVYMKADTTLNSHEVDLFLDIYPSRDNLEYKRFKFNDITIVSGYNMGEMPSTTTGGSRGQNRFFRSADTTQYNGLTIIRGENDFLRNSVIYRNDYLKRGRYYSDYMLSNTYEAYNKMGAVKQVNITTTPVVTDTANLMNVTVILVPAQVHSFKASLEGTNSAGDIGVAPVFAYQHQNLFNGSEQLVVRLKGSYEFVGNSSQLAGGSNYYEYGVDVGLKFPMFLLPWIPKKFRESPSATTNVSVGFTNQKRVQYAREFFNMTLSYGWNNFRNKLTNQFDLMDINYVRMPWTSKAFQTDYLDNPSNPLIRETYKNQLVASTVYSGVFTNSQRFNQYGAATVYRFRGELAGWLPGVVSAMSRVPRTGGDNSRKILGVAYAQYFKLQGEFAQTIYLSKVHSLAYRASLGVANPFDNSSILPFEQRFFGGGPNGVRGWQTRRLGPGSYKGNDSSEDFINQSGDISLILSVENRHKLNDLFSAAIFFDAGNIWTIRNYEGQEGGIFKFNKFYKQIAASYGVGLRFDMQFILRMDLGIQLYDPSREAGKKWVEPAFRRMALHFGIGYPF